MSNTYREYTELYWWEENANHTYKNTRDGYCDKRGKKNRNKMPSYTKDRWNWKFTPQSFNGIRNTSRSQKEIANNANRSLKKAKRQQLKKELKIEIESIFIDNLK